MTIASPRSIPQVFAAAALALSAGAASLASPAIAAPAGAYTVTLAAPLDAPRKEIINGKMWRCEGDTCSAAASGSRAVITCQRVATEFGVVASFTGPQGELSAKDLARCNEG